MPEANGLLLGVDGGNTKTIALLARPDGTIVGAGRSGCSDIFNAPSPEAALREIDRAVAAALAAGGAASGDIGRAVFCLAGADWPEDLEFLLAQMKQRGYGRATDVLNDAISALRAGTEDGVGAVFSCGTGFAAAARNANGRTWHSGFWAEPLGGAWLGGRALLAVQRAELGLDPPTALRPALLAHYDVADVASLLRRLYGHAIPSPTDVELARLAPAVFDAAQGGDPTASAMVLDQGARLARYATMAARQVDLDAAAVPLVLNGGLFRHSGGQLLAAIRGGLPADAFRELRVGRQPAIGALLLAFDQPGAPAPAAIVDRIEQSSPSQALFRTADR
jgi:N-acetylglucosamine kinase-like BadF-type ATPase